MKQTYTRTLTACYTGYVVQAIVNNFAPLLFLTFQSTYDISMGRITLLITINFIVQLMTDFLSAGFIDRIGYRASMLIAHAASAAGLFCLPLLPELLPNPFAGLLIAVVIYAVGGGLLEVMVSPVVEALPTDNKEKTMSMLHSFYCWGHVAVVLISTIFSHCSAWKTGGSWLLYGLLSRCTTSSFSAKCPYAHSQKKGKKDCPSLTLSESPHSGFLW